MLKTEEKVGTFLACFEIGDMSRSGGTMCGLKLMVNAPSRKVTGHFHITNTNNPPLNLDVEVFGTFWYMTLNNGNTHIGLHLHSVSSPTHIVPLYPVDLNIVLEGDWQSGTANYKYINVTPPWIEINDAPVKSVDCNADME